MKFNETKFEQMTHGERVGVNIEPYMITTEEEIKVKIKTDLIENLGFEKIIYTSIDGSEFRIKTSKNIENNISQISFSKENVYFFDKEKIRIKKS